MLKFKFYEAQNYSNNKRFVRYDIHGALMECCQRIITLSQFIISYAKVTITGGEMEPDERIYISSFEELLSLNKVSNISLCSFKGKYNGVPIDVVVDYDFKQLKLLSVDKQTIEAVIGELEDK